MKSRLKMAACGQTWRNNERQGKARTSWQYLPLCLYYYIMESLKSRCLLLLAVLEHNQNNNTSTSSL